MTDQRTATLDDVDQDAQIIAWRHRLGCEVIVKAYGHDGQPVGYLMANPITDDEVEVVVTIPGTIARLVADPVAEGDAGS